MFVRNLAVQAGWEYQNHFDVRIWNAIVVQQAGLCGQLRT